MAEQVSPAWLLAQHAQQLGQQCAQECSLHRNVLRMEGVHSHYLALCDGCASHLLMHTKKPECELATPEMAPQQSSMAPQVLLDAQEAPHWGVWHTRMHGQQLCVKVQDFGTRAKCGTRCWGTTPPGRSLGGA